MRMTTTTGGGSTLRSIRLWRDERQDESDEAILREQLEAMRAFAEGWLEPLAVAVDVVCCDPARGHSSYSVAPPPIQSWLLRTRARGVEMEPRRIGSRIDECDVIDPQVIETYVHRALDQRCVGNAVTGMDFLSWEAFRVKLPGSGVTQFIIEDVALEVPIERLSDGDWVSGPRSERLTGGPFWFHFTEGELRFDVVWSLWLEDPGRQQVDAAVGRVLARGTGWYRAP